MTALKSRIARLIAASGPMSVADYMAMCLFDPEAGYYTTREPFGRSGDFVTAPEVSQMFGELTAVWLTMRWREAGSPKDAIIAEIGPGRGTLMKDMARIFRQLDAAMCETSRFTLIEISERLRQVQKEALASSGLDFRWFGEIDQLPEGPLFIVGNELFDAVPVRQFVKTDAGWRERCVGIDGDGGLCFVASVTGVDPALLPPAAATAPIGAIVEIAPAREALMETVCARIAAAGGAALFIDYGHLQPGLGDTLQAQRNHVYDDVLAHPGEADITSHVDFAALASAVSSHGLETELCTQGQFLLSLGLLERAGQLGAALDEAGREQIRDAVERLAGPEQMGELFKVLAVMAPGRAQSSNSGAD
ncbi:MAG: class I SAM-dependent methyltransferase [Brucellaceae bacterium]|nr:class I SAM-dependent methyltransferase [Brucellaceae bacterium]